LFFYNFAITKPLGKVVEKHKQEKRNLVWRFAIPSERGLYKFQKFTTERAGILLQTWCRSSP